jgi:sialic acid synthase SpsE
MKATACDIHLACTAFSPELVKAVDPYVHWHKVASSDMGWPQLLDAAIATGKPIKVSTGGASPIDIERTLHYVRDRAPTVSLTLLYCVSAYPARTTDFDAIANMSKLHGHWGISDHSTEVLSIPLEAQKYGAHVIEKHFTHFPELNTPDRPHSLTSSEFKRMVDRLRGKAEPMQPSYEEVDMLLKHRRRLVATTDVQPGETLSYGVNYGAYRVAIADMKGIGAMDWQVAEGVAASRPILKGQPIGPGDLG